MKIGIVPINVGGPETAAEMIEFARYAEAAGIESVWTFEHAMVPIEYNSRYPYAKSGKMPIAPETWFVDPLVSLSHVAAATETLKLGTGINILPQTNPLLFAKQAASLDVLSDGRLMLGVGAGWLEEEFAAMGTPFARRGARMNEYIEAIKRVWSGETVEFDGEFLSWHGFVSCPQPVQEPHPPLLIGGASDRALRRVVQYGDGWYAPNAGPDDLSERLARLWELADAHGRDRDTIDVTGSWLLNRNPDAVSAYEDLGVTRVVVPIFATGATHWRDAVDRVAEAAKL